MENSLTYPIKVVSQKTGLSIHVIRAWEKRYNVVIPQRTDTNRRLYTENDVEKLRLLSIASNQGYSIGSIAHYSIDELNKILGNENADDSIEESNKNLQNDQAHQGIYYLDRCLDAIINLNAQELEKVLYRALVDLPQPKFLEDLISPLLTRIGELWKKGEIRIVNEHVSTAIIRKTLTSLIDNNSIPHNAPTILIATPKGQLHELGALIIGVVASADGWNVVYMGPDLPGEEIAAAVERLHPKILALSIVYPSDDFTLDREMMKLKNLLNNGSKIIAGGRSALAYEEVLRKMNAKIIPDLKGFRKELEISRV